MSRVKVPFTKDDDVFLTKYIATYAPAKDGRLGNNIYKQLSENPGGKWPWSAHHPWQSWRERYKTNEYYFDSEIRKYQKKHGINVPEKNERLDSSKFSSQVDMKHSSKLEHNVEGRQPEKSQQLVTSGAARKTASMTTMDAKEPSAEGSGQKRKGATEQEDEAKNLAAKRRRVKYDSASPANKGSDSYDHQQVAAILSTQKPLTIDRGVGTHDLADETIEGDVDTPVMEGQDQVKGSGHDRPDVRIGDELSPTGVAPHSQLTEETGDISSVNDDLEPAVEEAHQDEVAAPPAITGSNLNKIANKSNLKLQDEDYFASDGESPQMLTESTKPKSTGKGRPREPIRSRDLMENPRAKGRKRRSKIMDVDSDVEIEDSALAISPALDRSLEQKSAARTQAQSSNEHEAGTSKRDESNAKPQPTFTSKTAVRPKISYVGRSRIGKTNPRAEDVEAESRKEGSTMLMAKPIRLRGSLSSRGEQQSISQDIQAWREETEAYVVEDQSPNAPSAAPNPFARTDVGNTSGHGGLRKTSSQFRTSRRKTFGGFTREKSGLSKEIDLRKRLARRSIASALPGASSNQSVTPPPTASSIVHTVGRRSGRSSVASSVNSALALLPDDGPPDVPTSSYDDDVARRVGYSFMFRAMSDNYNLPEQWLRDTFKIVRRMEKVDELGRAIAIAAELADDDDDVGDEGGTAGASDDLEGNSEYESRPSDAYSSEIREVVPLQSSSKIKPRAGLQILPDSLPRIREKYSPPRPSRAASYARLKKEGREEEARERERRRTSSHSPTKRLETDAPTSSPIRLPSVNSGSGMHSSPNNPPWTEEEDNIILDASDIDALRELEERHGEGSVRRRHIYLMGSEF